MSEDSKTNLEFMMVTKRRPYYEPLLYLVVIYIEIDFTGNTNKVSLTLSFTFEKFLGMIEICVCLLTRFYKNYVINFHSIYIRIVVGIQ